MTAKKINKKIAKKKAKKAKKKVVKKKKVVENQLYTHELTGRVIYHKKAREYGEFFGGKAVGWTEGSASRGKELVSLQLGLIDSSKPVSTKQVKDFLSAHLGYMPMDLVEKILGPKKFLDMHIKLCVHLDQKVKPKYQAQYDAFALFNDETIKNLLCCACEGGSNYWANSPDNNYKDVGAEYFHEAPVHKDGFFIITDKEDEEVNVKVNREALNKGILAFVEKYPHHAADALDENEDADTGDVFLQCCCFGEAIYG